MIEKTQKNVSETKKQIAILGSTGSIGTQALDVIEQQAHLFEVYALTANNQVDLLIAQARKFLPEMVAIANDAHYQKLKEALADLPIKVFAGDAASTFWRQQTKQRCPYLCTIDRSCRENPLQCGGLYRGD